MLRTEQARGFPRKIFSQTNCELMTTVSCYDKADVKSLSRRAKAPLPFRNHSSFLETLKQLTINTNEAYVSLLLTVFEKVTKSASSPVFVVLCMSRLPFPVFKEKYTKKWKAVNSLSFCLY